jgi:hypothetical protein
MNRTDRAVISAFTRLIPVRRRLGLLVTAATILRWHRQLVAHHWTTTPTRPGRPAIPAGLKWRTGSEARISPVEVPATVAAAFGEPVAALIRVIGPRQMRPRRPGLLAPCPRRPAPAPLLIRRRRLARIIIARGRVRGVRRVARQQMLQPGQPDREGLVGLHQLRDLHGLRTDLSGLARTMTISSSRDISSGSGTGRFNRTQLITPGQTRRVTTGTVRHAHP